MLVTDNGPGIPYEQRERVFERFYSILDDGAEGSGLGLVIDREIARMHGAETRIDFAPIGTGTRFTVVFSMTVPEQTTPRGTLYSRTRTGS